MTDNNINYLAKLLELKDNMPFCTYKEEARWLLENGVKISVKCKDCKYQDDCARQMVHTTRDYVLATVVDGKLVWSKDSSFSEKEEQAAIKLCSSIKSWRESHPSRRDNEELISYVHDFYKDVK